MFYAQLVFFQTIYFKSVKDLTMRKVIASMDKAAQKWWITASDEVMYFVNMNLVLNYTQDLQKYYVVQICWSRLDFPNNLTHKKFICQTLVIRRAKVQASCKHKAGKVRAPLVPKFSRAPFLKGRPTFDSATLIKPSLVSQAL